MWDATRRYICRCVNNKKRKRSVRDTLADSAKLVCLNPVHHLASTIALAGSTSKLPAVFTTKNVDVPSPDT